MTACHNVGIAEFGILGEQTNIYIRTSLAGREKILLPLKVTVIARNSADLVMKGHGPGGQREFLKRCIVCTKLEVASR